ncbi:hypothetical protein NFI96_022597, partial [Prochilodus magdalenae]
MKSSDPLSDHTLMQVWVYLCVSLCVSVCETETRADREASREERPLITLILKNGGGQASVPALIAAVVVLSVLVVCMGVALFKERVFRDRARCGQRKGDSGILPQEHNGHGEAQIYPTVGMPELKLKQECVTRWNSTFHRLKRILDSKDAVTSTLAVISALVDLCLKEWEALQEACTVLEPFEQVTVEVSADGPCEFLCDVNTEELEAADPLYSG